MNEGADGSDAGSVKDPMVREFIKCNAARSEADREWKSLKDRYDMAMELVRQREARNAMVKVEPGAEVKLEQESENVPKVEIESVKTE